MRAFLQKSMQVADNVVFLSTVNHAFTNARERDVREAGFGLREIYLIDRPESFPRLGFLLGCLHWQREYSGPIWMNDGREHTSETEEKPCAKAS